MPIDNTDKNRIKQLLNKGYTGSEIAKSLHRRKQDVLSAIREIENRPITQTKINNKRGQKGKSAEVNESKIKSLYEKGLPLKELYKQFPDNSHKVIREKIRQLPQESTDKRKSVMASKRGIRKKIKKFKQPSAEYYLNILVETIELSQEYGINIPLKNAIPLTYKIFAPEDINNYLDNATEYGAVVEYFFTNSEGQELAESDVYASLQV